MAIQSILAELITYSSGTLLLYRAIVEILRGNTLCYPGLLELSAKVIFRRCSLLLSQLTSTKEKHLKLFLALFSTVGFCILLSSDWMLKLLTERATLLF